MGRHFLDKDIRHHRIRRNLSAPIGRTGLRMGGMGIAIPRKAERYHHTSQRHGNSPPSLALAKYFLCADKRSYSDSECDRPSEGVRIG